MYFPRKMPSMSKTPTLTWVSLRSLTIFLASAAVLTSSGFMAPSGNAVEVPLNRFRGKVATRWPACDLHALHYCRTCSGAVEAGRGARLDREIFLGRIYQ